MNEAKPITTRMIAIAACFGGVLALLLLIISKLGFFGALLIGLIVAAIVLLVLMFGWADAYLKPAEPPASAVTSPKPSSAAASEPAPVAEPVAEVEPVAAPKPPAAPEPPVAPEPVVEPAPAPEPVAKPKPAAVKPAEEPAPVAAEAVDAGKPAALTTAREGGADDLKLIKGVGPKLETMLNGMGIYHFDQVASWGPAEQKWVDENLQGFKGRATRDKWVEQAKTLAAG
ncbi:NADH:ubiquinone oxidoreductase [Yoonia maritima]|uniref:NADH:ubiquinone oxidoreductase n=1 Tax=Yoonia maritima TaxID=1435347 RepID=UPI0037365BB3